jgi:hypothetical protein
MSKWPRRLIIIAVASLLVIFTVIALGYWFKWDWSGFIFGYSKVTIEKSGKEGRN